MTAESFANHLAAGARNLLVGCAGLRPGQNTLIIAEDPALGWYDAAAPAAVAQEARALGAAAEILPAAGPETPPTAELARRIAAADVVIYFARIGDQDRFSARQGGPVEVVSYARTAETLAAPFAQRPHAEMAQLKAAVNRRFAAGGALRLTCAEGTRITGRLAPMAAEADVAIRRFPLSVPAPVTAATLSGRVAVVGWLTPTGSEAYAPACLALDQVIFAEVEAGRLQGFTGDPATVRAAEAHYARIADQFGIDGAAIHSWHAGIHPDCPDDERPPGDPDLWSNTVFGSPRFAHFHTCGDYAPGEICWMIRDPEITLDGRTLWRGGALMEEARSDA